MRINKIPHKFLFILLLLSLAVAYSSDSFASRQLRLALLGDSMTWIGGDSCQNEMGWSHWIRGRGNIYTIDLYARSGATWTNTASTRIDTTFYSEVIHDDNVIYNQALRLVGRVKSGKTLPPDIVIVFAGANDAWFADRRPGIFELSQDVPVYSASTLPSEATTLQQSVLLTCDLLMEKLSGSTLMIVTPLEMSKVVPATTTKVSDIIESAAKSRGIRTLRADREVPIRHEEEQHKPRYTSDGVHTNREGAIIVANYIMTMSNLFYE